MRALPLLLLVMASLPGCGVKGSLYLPAAKPPAAPKPEAIVTPDPERPVPPEAAPPPK